LEVSWTRFGTADRLPRYVHLSSTIAVAYKRSAGLGQPGSPGHSIYGYVSPGAGRRGTEGALNVAPALTWKVAC